MRGELKRAHTHAHSEIRLYSEVENISSDTTKL